MNKAILQKIFSEMLPFVARSPEMKVEWLLGVFRKNILTDTEISPYMHLLLTEYESDQDISSLNIKNSVLVDIFSELPRKIITRMIECTEIYDIPTLLELIKEISTEEAILVLQKSPPVYEKKPLIVFDRVFQALQSAGENLIELAAEEMRARDILPDHFDKAYERFKEILMDEKILLSIYPDVKA